MMTPEQETAGNAGQANAGNAGQANAGNAGQARTIGYVLHPPDDDDPLTLELQRSMIENVCNHGLDLCEITVEESKWSKRPFHTRPQARRVERLVRDRAVDYVVVARPGIMVGGAPELIYLAEEWKKLGVGLVVADCGGVAVDFMAEPEPSEQFRVLPGSTLVDLLNDFHDFKSAMEREQKRGERRHRRKHGRLPLGRAGWGWVIRCVHCEEDNPTRMDMNPDNCFKCEKPLQLVPVEEDLVTLGLIYDYRTRDPKVAYIGVADELQRRGRPRKHRACEELPWTWQSVQQIWRNNLLGDPNFAATCVQAWRESEGLGG